VTSVPASTGNYTVKASYSGCTTIESAPVNIKVATLPVAAFTVVASACANQKVLFTIQSTFDVTATPVYSWNFDDGQSSTLKDPEHIFTTAGTYDVVLTVSYAGGACPDTETKQVTVTAAPAVAITNPDNEYSVCEGGSLVLEVLGSFNSYTWSTGATTPSITVSEGGTYLVDVTTNTCTLSASRVVTGLEAPEVIVSATPEQINEGQTSQLQASGLTSFTWQPAESLNNNAIANPVATPLQTTTYTVTGLGTNGCEGTATVIVKVAGEVIVNKLSPSNFFSPNNDGPNEVWVVDSILDYPQCGVVVYDDKGVKVFDAKPYQNDWNGTFNGKTLPDGVYFYIIRCDGEEGTPRTGSITLIR
jgi:gliding motility-associated-like protein